MNKIHSLEINKLINEYNYFKSDYDYKYEVVHNADSEFIQEVNNILDQNPELRKIYDEKTKREEPTEVHDNDIETHFSESSEIIPIDDSHMEKSPHIKDVYRSIVKVTHPDKVEDKSLHEIYIDATNHYNNNDVMSLYTICYKLGISYNEEDIDRDYILKEINIAKSKVSMIEDTFTWQWKNSHSDDIKSNIILIYIKNQIR